MKKLLQTLLLISFFSVSAFAQINGSTTVCAGYTYSYTVSILNASTFTWTLPIGWYDITGQGTSQINATCNLNEGAITVEGFNPNGISVGIETIAVQFSAGSGWGLSSINQSSCEGTYVIMGGVIPNGTGGGPGCPAGCGTGNQHPNINYALYDGPWPSGNFITVLPGGFLMPNINTTYYVYKIDNTTGNIPITQAILIDGGCGNAIVNNSLQLTPVTPLPWGYTQLPDPVCVGDTVAVQAGNMATFQWQGVGPGLTLLNGFTNPAVFIADSANPLGSVIGMDFSGCPNGGFFVINTDSCITTGIHKQSITQNIKLTPNPATNFVLVKTNYNTAVPLQIYNALGQIVFENKNVVQQINILVKNFAKGVYTVKAGNVVKRFLKR